jgi:cobyrinic acid a,c-diamide synthase
MIELMIAAPSSGSGKTAITCGLLTILKRLGQNPCAFKCGPDYIDPMFHRAVLGVESHNLDLFLSEKETIHTLYRREASGHRSVVCEGVMGFYDGVGGTTTQASAWEIADTLDLPVILVIRPKGASLTLAAQLRGLCEFQNPNHIIGVILNDCSEMLYRSLAPMLERETGLTVFGYLPHMPEAQLESRHLGLYTAQEIADLSERIECIADKMEHTLSLSQLLKRCDRHRIFAQYSSVMPESDVRIAVAQDQAFCFTYAENLEELRRCGGKIIPFSPLHDERIPDDIHGLYLPGGYPELHAQQLACNYTMRQSIYTAVSGGLPTIAECGGFLYLGKSLEDQNGTPYEMVGFLQGEGRYQNRLVRFGYAELTAMQDSMLFHSGDRVPVHEFHYWDSSENGHSMKAVKPISGRRWKCAVTTETLYAGFPHLYFAGNPKLTERFLAAARKYKKIHLKK